MYQTAPLSTTSAFSHQSSAGRVEPAGSYLQICRAVSAWPYLQNRICRVVPAESYLQIRIWRVVSAESYLQGRVRRVLSAGSQSCICRVVLAVSYLQGSICRVVSAESYPQSESCLQGRTHTVVFAELYLQDPTRGVVPAE